MTKISFNTQYVILQVWELFGILNRNMEFVRSCTVVLPEPFCYSFNLISLFVLLQNEFRTLEINSRERFFYLKPTNVLASGAFGCKLVVNL